MVFFARDGGPPDFRGRPPSGLHRAFDWPAWYFLQGMAGLRISEAGPRRASVGPPEGPKGTFCQGDPTPGPGEASNATIHILDLFLAAPGPPEAAGSQECEEALCRSHTRTQECEEALCRSHTRTQECERALRRSHTQTQECEEALCRLDTETQECEEALCALAFRVYAADGCAVHDINNNIK